jgi:FkbM family methyltransferase
MEIGRHRELAHADKIGLREVALPTPEPEELSSQPGSGRSGVTGKAPSMQITVPVDDGEPIEFECADTFVSRWINHEILVGKTYPYLPFVDDVQVVLDVGANCGATSVHLARHYPDAQVHSFEPATGPRAYLERNVARFPNVHVHPIGLYSSDAEMPLYVGKGDSIVGSVIKRKANLDESESVQMRAAGPWLAAAGIERIDILKVDVEGAEVEVVESLASLLPTVKVLYLEYDSRHARAVLSDLIERTHELYVGVMYLDQGECVYLRKDIADHPDAVPLLARLLRQAAKA